MKSISYRFLEGIIKLSGIKKMCQMNIMEITKMLDKKFSNQKYKPTRKINRKYVVEEIVISNGIFYKIQPKKTNSLKEIIFIHGGGYMVEISFFHWVVISKLIDKLKATVYIPIYPLTPMHTYKDSICMMEELYEIVLKNTKNNDISIMGDSSGAQIGLSFCMKLKLDKVKQPRKLLLLSPIATFSPDLNMIQKMKEIEKNDCMLSVNLLDIVAKFWTTGTSLKDYLVSPLYGDFSQLPDMYIFSGTHDILNAQAYKMIEKARDAGVNVEYYEGEEMMHTWAYYFISSECKKTLNKMIEILSK